VYNQQQGSSFGQTTAFGGFAAAQNRGQQKTYQPIGMVQSQYDQKQQSQQSFGMAGQSQQFGQSFHTSAYRGNQAGHDNYLHSDSQNPSNFGTGVINSPIGSSYGIARQATGSQFAGNSSYQTANQFHTANYRGNEAGHDQQWRSDSQTPTQSSFQSGYGSIGIGATQFQPQGQNQFQGSTYVPTQSYHTSNYRGNQPGHDSSWRSDSTQPTSSYNSSISGAGTYRF